MWKKKTENRKTCDYCEGKKATKLMGHKVWLTDKTAFTIKMVNISEFIVFDSQIN